jgi:hypothetical protein
MHNQRIQPRDPGLKDEPVSIETRLSCKGSWRATPAGGFVSVSLAEQLRIGLATQRRCSTRTARDEPLLALWRIECHQGELRRGELHRQRRAGFRGKGSLWGHHRSDDGGYLAGYVRLECDRV